MKLTGGSTLEQIHLRSLTISLETRRHVHRFAARSITTRRSVSTRPAAAPAAAGGTGAATAAFLFGAPRPATFLAGARLGATFSTAAIAATSSSSSWPSMAASSSESSCSSSSFPSWKSSSAVFGRFFVFVACFGASLGLPGPALAALGCLGTTITRSGLGGLGLVFFFSGDSPVELSASKMATFALAACRVLFVRTPRSSSSLTPAPGPGFCPRAFTLPWR